jgi:hypothetical protein
MRQMVLTMPSCHRQSLRQSQIRLPQRMKKTAVKSLIIFKLLMIKKVILLRGSHRKPILLVEKNFFTFSQSNSFIKNS